MACYTRHLGELLEEAGLENNRQTRLFVDKGVRCVLNMPEADCPVVWRELKAWLVRPEQRSKLVASLKESRQALVQE